MQPTTPPSATQPEPPPPPVTPPAWPRPRLMIIGAVLVLLVAGIISAVLLTPSHTHFWAQLHPQPSTGPAQPHDAPFAIPSSALAPPATVAVGDCAMLAPTPNDTPVNDSPNGPMLFHTGAFPSPCMEHATFVLAATSASTQCPAGYITVSATDVNGPPTDCYTIYDTVAGDCYGELPGSGTPPLLAPVDSCGGSTPADPIMTVDTVLAAGLTDCPRADLAYLVGRHGHQQVACLKLEAQTP